MAGIIPAAGAGSAGGQFRRRRYTPIADINVTPLVDVMLVLLIIFMVTAPLLQVGVPVDLPKTSAQQVGGKDEPLVVSVNSKGEVFLGETKYELAELGAKLKAVHEEKPDQRVFMRGDKAIDYGRMMEVMGVVIDSGFRQLGLLGEQAQQLGKGGGTVTPAPAARRHRRPAAPAPAPVEDRRRSDRCSTAHPASVEMRTPAIVSAMRACRRAGGGGGELRFLQSAAADGARAGDGRVRGDRQEGGRAQGRQSAAAAQGRPIAEETTKAPPPKTAEPPPRRPRRPSPTSPRPSRRRRRRSRSPSPSRPSRPKT